MNNCKDHINDHINIICFEIIASYFDFDVSQDIILFYSILTLVVRK